MDDHQHHESHPAATYGTNGTAQYNPSQYTYPAASASYPIDSALVMPQHYTSHDSIDSRLQSDATVSSGTSHLAPAMNGLHSPTAMKRKPSEDVNDLGAAVGDPKRKRSKVSRACDQCRKKKIRCDADTENGILKTCSNCTKANQLCEYSRIPQKRGPSKGYIKELSERVQQVEGQLALQTSATYRSSVDGPATSVYPDQFSPDDENNPNFRRQSSFSQQRNPFADFQRDRFPSVGGWATNGVTSHPQQRERDRSSIAVPPDQQASSAASQIFSKPFWHEWLESPPKRRKLSHPLEEGAMNLEVTADMLAPYYTHLQPKANFLPGTETTVNILKQCSPSYRVAFVCSINLLPNADELQPGSPISQTSLNSRNVLDDFLQSQPHDLVHQRSDHEILVLVWTCIITSISRENRGDRPSLKLSPSTILQVALETYSVSQGIGKDLFSGPLAEHHKRAIAIVWLLIRLQCFASGRADDVMPSALFEISSQAVTSLGPTLAFECSAAHMFIGMLSMNQIAHQSTSHYIQLFRNTSNILAENMYMQFATNADPSTVKIICQMLELLKARIHVHFFPPDISGPAISLAESLQLRSEAESSQPWQYDPILYHAYALATFTLLELDHSIHEDDPADSVVQDCLKNLQTCLHKESEKIGGSPGHAPPATLNWASLLGKLIEAKMRQTNSLAADGKQQNALGTINFGELLKVGYTQLLGMWGDFLDAEVGEEKNGIDTTDRKTEIDSSLEKQHGETRPTQNGTRPQNGEEHEKPVES